MGSTSPTSWKAGKVVAYNYRNQHRIVLAPPVSELRAKKAEEKATEEQAKKKADENAKAAEQKEGDKRQYVLSLLNDYQHGELAFMVGKEETEVERNSSLIGVWGSVDESSEFWTKLLENEETWLLVDLHRGDDYEDGQRPCKIVLTSTLRKGDWPDLDSGGSTLSRKLFMAPLSLEEATNISSAAKLSITHEEIGRRFTQFGGSARFLFNAGAESKVNEAFQTGVQIVLDPNIENTVRSSALVHIIAGENFEFVGRKWASLAIGERVVDALIESTHAGEQVWLEATNGKTGKHIMGARGIFAERMWHRAVKSENAILLKKLVFGDKSKAAEVKMLVKAFHRTRRFSKADLSDLTKMEVGEYLLPDNDQFPDADAIAVLNHDPWQSEEASTEAEQRDGSTCLVFCYKWKLVEVTSAHKGKHWLTSTKRWANLLKITLLASPGRPYT